MTFTLGTFCTGIASAEKAFAPLGAVSAYMAEIEPYPSAVLAYRHGAGRPRRVPSPDDAATPKEAAERRARIKALDRVPYWGNEIVNFGDMTQIDPDELPFVDILVAGCPCQAFSIAGLRKSLNDARGNLTLYFVKLVHELVRLGRIRSVLYENVPDLLNTEDNAFGAFVGALVGHDAPLVSPLKGGRWTNAGVADGPLGAAAWRVEDGQFSGVAQRRERLFLVASFGNGPDPVEVLFERQGLSRDPPARGKAGEGFACAAAEGASSRSARERTQRRASADVAPTLLAQGNRTGGDRPPGTTVDTCESLIPVAYSIMPQNSGKDYKAREVDVAQPLMAAGPVGGNQGGDYVLQPVAYRTTGNDGVYETGDIVGALTTTTDPNAQLVAFSCKDHGADAGDISPTLRSTGHAGSHPNAGGQVAVAFSLRGREGGAQAEVETDGLSPALRAAEGGSTRPFVAFAENTRSEVRLEGGDGPTIGALSTGGGKPGQGMPAVSDGMAVRRITCVEAERLMGFDDNYTLIPWPTANRKGEDLEQTITYLIGHGYEPEAAALLAQTPDGPRYKALGNSKIVPHVRKIGASYQAALERYLAARAAA